MIVSEELYLNYKRDVDRIDVDFKMYEKETNFQINSDYQLNQMIFDIVKSKYFFIIEITKKIKCRKDHEGCILCCEHI